MKIKNNHKYLRFSVRWISISVAPRDAGLQVTRGLGRYRGLEEKFQVNVYVRETVEERFVETFRRMKDEISSVCLSV